jgi:hypothetical protein
MCAESLSHMAWPVRKVNSGWRADRGGRVYSRSWAKVARRHPAANLARCQQCLELRHLVIRDDRHRVAGHLRQSCRYFLEDVDLAVNARYLRHLLFKLKVAAFSLTSWSARILQTALWSGLSRHAWPSTGPCSRMPRPINGVVYNLWAHPSPSPCGRPATATTLRPRPP